MQNLIPLLKYLDRKKITPEAVIELAHLLFHRTLPLDTAAEIANAFRTRGMAGMVPMLPKLLSAPPSEDQSSLDEPRQIPHQCSHCGSIDILRISQRQFDQL
jgi:hypothetical protein